MFKKKQPNQATTKDIPNPYLNAKKQWNFIMGKPWLRELGGNLLA